MTLTRWFLGHWVTYSFIVFHVLVSLLFHYFAPSNPYVTAFLGTFGAPSSHFVAFHIIFSLLFRGVEVSIGSFEYLQWLLWSAASQFLFRQICHFALIGPSFLVFCPFVTFYIVHRPYLYFRLFRFRFKDSLLYSIAVCQYIANDVKQLPFDLLGCLVSNLLWKYVIGFWRRLRRTQNPGAEAMGGFAEPI
jgi:hypothetical protein